MNKTEEKLDLKDQISQLNRHVSDLAFQANVVYATRLELFQSYIQAMYDTSIKHKTVLEKYIAAGQELKDITKIEYDKELLGKHIRSAKTELINTEQYMEEYQKQLNRLNNPNKIQSDQETAKTENVKPIKK